ncbi:MAG: hypothetical protein JXR78_18280 [Victivallales bacterium]|nr:hypothetical protein [Victivallales bacterium]
MMIEQLQGFLKQNHNAGKNPVEVASGDILPLYPHKSIEPLKEGGCGCLRAGNDAFLLSVFFQDSDIFNVAVCNDQPTWELGDVVEFFIQLPGHEDYYEFHVTPDNVTLQLHLACNNEKYILSYKDNLFDGGLKSSTQICHEDNFWYAEMDVPYAVLGTSSSEVDGSRFSIGRYNYSRKWDKPEISSTAYFGNSGFHSPECWHVIKTQEQ